MVTENGDSRYPPLSGSHDLPSRRRIPHPLRLDPLRINPPSPRPSTAGSSRPPLSSRPPPFPRSPRKHLDQTQTTLHDSFWRSVSPHRVANDDFAIRGPPYRSPTFPIPPQERFQKPVSRDGEFDRPSHRRTPPLRTSRSTSRLNSRRPRAPQTLEGPSGDSNSQGLPLLRPTHGSSDAYAEDVLRSSVNSAMTSRSSIEHASGTERSSVLTKSSSITDLSPDTPDGPYGKDGDMSVEDAISMYLDGFSDVTEEPASPDLHVDAKRRPWSPRPPTERTIDGDHTFDELSPDLLTTKDLPPVPPLPNLNPPDQNTVDKQFLGEAKPDEILLDEALGETSSDPPGDSVPQETKIIIPGIVPPPLLLETETRDRYGFRKSSHHITLEQYEAWNGHYTEFAANRRIKWMELLRENSLPTDNPTTFPPRTNKVKRFVRKGVPSEYRGAAWFWYAGGYEHLHRNPGLYDRLAKQAMESPSNNDKEHIERDLHRTFPDNLHFKPESANQPGNSGSSNPKYSSVIVETQMIESLRRVLYAFSLHNPQVGYTQSLNFITGLLLLFLPEEKAFWLLHIITSVYLPGTHEISLEGANIDLWILMILLKETLPQAYNKIVNTGGSPSGKTKAPALTVNSGLPDITLGLTNWLMSLFIGTLPLETTLRVWDVFFFEGSKTFFRVSLAIFKACERDIMAVSDPMEVFQVVQTVPKKLLDANTLMDECFVRRHRVGQGRIEELRAARRTAFRQEKLRRSQAFSKGQIQAATDEWPTRSRTPIAGIERSLADSWRHMRHNAFR